MLETMGHPRLAALARLWSRKANGADLHGRVDFDPVELRPWLGRIILLDVVDGGRDFHYRLFGAELVERTG